MRNHEQRCNSFSVEANSQLAAHAQTRPRFAHRRVTNRVDFRRLAICGLEIGIVLAFVLVRPPKFQPGWRNWKTR